MAHGEEPGERVVEAKDGEVAGVRERGEEVDGAVGGEGAEVREGAVEVLRVTHARARPVVVGDDEHELVALAQDDVDGVGASHASANRVRHSRGGKQRPHDERERASVELSDTGDA